MGKGNKNSCLSGRVLKQMGRELLDDVRYVEIPNICIFPVSKRRMDPVPARECPTSEEPTTVAPQAHTLQHLLLPGPSYAPPGRDGLYGHSAWHNALAQHQHQPQVLSSVAPVLPHVQASIPNMFPQLQITASPWYPSGCEVSKSLTS